MPTLRAATTRASFNMSKDLLLVQCDLKTDVDDVHVLAALATLVAQPEYKKLNYMPIVGTYGRQGGLYVPPEPLCKLAYGRHWLDAHNKPEKALRKALKLAYKTIKKGGDIWIAEAGQSDFSAKLVKALLEKKPELDTKARIHIYQHSKWNEKQTTPADLAYVKEYTDYHKIDDGNATNNKTPGYKIHKKIDWKAYFKDKKLIQIWELAVDIANTYNGKDKRWRNPGVADGGLDFSDMVEVTSILGINDKAHNVAEFLEAFAQ